MVMVLARLCSRRSLFFFLLASLICALGASAALADDFSSALASFHTLSKQSPRSADLARWSALASEFRHVYQRSPGGPHAAESLYHLGRIHEAMGLRSQRQRDFVQAADYYQRVHRRFPSSPLAPDALLRRAMMQRDQIHAPEAARTDARLVVERYPRSPAAPQARELLAALESPPRPAATKAAAPAPAAAKPGGKDKATAKGEKVPPQTAAPTSPSPAVAEAGKAATTSPGAKGRGGGKAGRASKTPPPKAGNCPDVVEQLGLSVRTIMIDAGHGGHDPGAHGHGLREKDVTLRLARLVAQKLQDAGFQVHLTRSKDVFVALEKRTAMANARKADLFLSLHCNAVGEQEVSGLETYSLNQASSQEAVRVAARENAVSAQSISNLQLILTDLMLNAKVKESRDLAGTVQARLLEGVRRRYSLLDRHIREAPFYVLMGARMPAVLVEVGYITNPAEAARLASDAYLATLADGLVAGVTSYKAKIERVAGMAGRSMVN